MIDAINDDKKVANFGAALKAVEEAHLESKAVPGLVRAMQSPKGNPRTMAAQALANLDVSEQAEIVLPALVDSLSHPVGARGNTVLAISKLGSKAKPAIPKLIELLDTDSEPGVRSNAVGALTQIGLDEEEVLKALQIALRDKDATVRWNAAMGICRADPTARDPLPVLLDAIREGGWKGAIAAEKIHEIDPELFSQTMKELENKGGHD